VLKTRVIPTLLLRNGGLVKGQKFKNHKYVGDPINAVKIFNEKEVDELVFLDISATPNSREPNYELIKDIASEAFMPFGYGGGIASVQQIERLFSLGVEKAIINSESFHNPKLITEASEIAGSQSIVVSMDVKKSIFGGYEVFIENGTKRTRIKPDEYAKKAQDLGAGELIVCSIDCEGTGSGYDIKLIDLVSDSVEIPVVALGGAGKLQHFSDIVSKTSVSAVAAGDFFVFYGGHRAVLITYPRYAELEQLFQG
jgi:imidazole glycerol-phosphate synthase subunit HisF